MRNIAKVFERFGMTSCNPSQTKNCMYKKYNNSYFQFIHKKAQQGKIEVICIPNSQ